MTTPRLYKTEAIVLRQRKLGEADRILTLLTPAYGKLDAKAKGVRKTTSRMSGHLQPLNRVMVQLAQGRTLDVVAGCETLESFHPVREDLDRLSRGLYAAELSDRILPERVEAVSPYRLLLDTLRRLQDDPSGEMALRHYEMRLLDESGFRPQLERCLGCQRPLPPQPSPSTGSGQCFFSPLAGGTFCPACGRGEGGSRPLSVNALKVLRALQRASYGEIGRLRMPPELSREVERHLRSYIVCVLERDVDSAAFVERLRREGQPLEAAP